MYPAYEQHDPTGAHENYDTLADYYEVGEPMVCPRCGESHGAFDPECDMTDYCYTCGLVLANER